MPEIPTIEETVQGYESSTWYGIGAPNGTPDAIVDKLNKAVDAALADPVFQAKFAELGGRTIPGSPADFGKLIADETEKWAKVVKFSGLRLE
jgi:tripartite-type tricarboxylate transporter receptor subunit TctC